MVKIKCEKGHWFEFKGEIICSCGKSKNKCSHSILCEEHSIEQFEELILKQQKGEIDLKVDEKIVTEYGKAKLKKK